MKKQKSFSVENDKLKVSDFKNCSDLQILKIDFYSCSFDEEVSQKFSELMKNCSSMQKLKIKFHNYYQYYVETFYSSNLAICLSKLNNLITFSLNFCDFDFFDKDLQSILHGLSKCQNLETLKLTLIQCAIEANLSLAFQNIKNLKCLILNLGDNFIEDAGASFLGSQLSKCSNLQNLKLQLIQNLVGYEGDIKLAQGLANCEQLKTLTIQLSPKYQFEEKKDFDDTCTNFFRELSKSKNLKNLRVSYFYDGMIMKDLIKGLKCLKNIFTIEYDFTINECNAIRASLMKLKYLVTFNQNTD
ncbi:hypothetical protein TTHERM_00361430 (macronuclear) [Tetrahymena thermophila SB210]|uniref:Kinase domain protein n=1 Tax=Tetrahymena thermophila (strain SB210) TaxID=312017 RepID=Q22PK1_TETTS|nr:hypothetical protein TTHERM_00361430 [Tetrahymena thermophila SB210]EAR87108.2 hypothetical protein TTHERM_00361430 [Tetrahymena thermophila SB210]|eukprot:XP_001007353.2 hypothetical protein TTHERM_00361430 [Tetrahymena thermophila SB210]